MEFLELFLTFFMIGRLSRAGQITPSVGLTVHTSPPIRRGGRPQGRKKSR